MTKPLSPGSGEKTPANRLQGPKKLFSECIYEPSRGRDYVVQFKALKCATDVVEAAEPVNHFYKEISEAMAIRRQLQKLVLGKNRMAPITTVYDLCAGNGLVGILAAFTLPVVSAISVDIVPRVRKGFASVSKWEYWCRDIMTWEANAMSDDIIVSSHPCRELAHRIIEQFLESEARALIMIPCCHLPKAWKLGLRLLDQRGLSHYDRWCMELAEHLEYDSDVKLFEDDGILSPANNVIVATR